MATARARWAMAALACVAWLQTGLGQQAVTIGRLLDAPFPSALEASPDGRAVAWVFDERGARNVWIARAPDFRGRRLTAYAADDGQEFGELAWAADGTAIVFVRGGAANRQGEVPNPTSDPAGVEQALWVVGLQGGEPRKVGTGSSPAVSPRGDLVAFVQKGAVWTAPLGAEGDATQLIRGRGQAQALRWSPDGRQLAFVSARGDHAFVGVYDLDASTLVYLDPSMDRDANPVWSPDAARVAFTRMAAVQDRLPFFPRRSGHPWSIRVADVKSGEAREVWKAAPGPGSVLWPVNAANQLFWGEGDRIVFPWERDGWVHLYSVSASASGAAAGLLTPGDFEVEDAALSRDRRHVVYSSNQDDIDRRHLWRVPVAGGAPGRLTPGSGIEWSPVPLEADSVAFFRSSGTMPARPALLAAGEVRDLAPDALPASFPSDALVEPQQVVFPAADGMPVHGQLFLPRDAREGDRRPGVLFFHGGSRRQMLLGWHNRGYYHNAYAFNQYLASRGYVVLSVNYRSGIGYGLEFREAPGYGASGASEFNDVLGAGLYLRGRPEVDPARVGLWGGSYGGFLTAMGLARASDLFAAGVDVHGVHDWNTGIRNFVPDYEPEAHPEISRVAFDSSPMAYVDGWRSPVLLIHGDDDRNVAFAESVTLLEALRERGVHVEQLVFPDEVHGFLLRRSWEAAYDAAADFFDRFLKGGPAERTPSGR